MSYERAIEAMQRASVEPPSFTAVERARRWAGDADVPSAALALRVRVAIALAIAGFVAMAVVDLARWDRFWSGRVLAVALPIATLVVTMLWLRRRDLAHQMLVRASLWSSLVIGVLVCGWDFTAFRSTGIPVVLGSGAAILMLGGRGLGLTSSAFAPRAFRRQLLLALVMAFADAQTLLFAGIVQLGLARRTWELEVILVDAGRPLLAGAVMVLAVWGLHRMRTWALFLNVLANLVIASAAMHGWLGLSIPVSAALGMTAVVQLLLPVPILARALGDHTPDRPPLGRYGAPSMRWLLIAVMAASPATVALGGVATHGWTDAIHRTRIRGERAAPAPWRRTPSRESPTR